HRLYHVCSGVVDDSTQNGKVHCSSNETFAQDHISRGACYPTVNCGDYDALASTGCSSFGLVQRHDLNTEERTAHSDVHGSPTYISGFYGRDGLAIRSRGCKGVILQY